MLRPPLQPSSGSEIPGPLENDRAVPARRCDMPIARGEMIETVRGLGCRGSELIRGLSCRRGGCSRDRSCRSSGSGGASLLPFFARRRRCRGTSASAFRRSTSTRTRSPLVGARPPGVEAGLQRVEAPVDALAEGDGVEHVEQGRVGVLVDAAAYRVPRRPMCLVSTLPRRSLPSPGRGAARHLAAPLSRSSDRSRLVHQSGQRRRRGHRRRRRRGASRNTVQRTWTRASRLGSGAIAKAGTSSGSRTERRSGWRPQAHHLVVRRGLTAPPAWRVSGGPPLGRRPRLSRPRLGPGNATPCYGAPHPPDRGYTTERPDAAASLIPSRTPLAGRSGRGCGRPHPFAARCRGPGARGRRGR